MHMYQRPLYLEQLLQFRNSPVVKVITGMRRCGKSALLELYRDALLNSGVPPERIFSFNFESLANADLLDYMALYKRVMAKAGETKEKVYLLFDEIQEVDGWQKAVNAFRVDLNADITITGSNARLLSGELATLIAGRYVEIRVWPLSFAEFLLFNGLKIESCDLQKAFDAFVRQGGLPGLHQISGGMEARMQYLGDIFDAVLLKDVVQRNNVRDVELLSRIIMFLMDNIGSLFSAKTVSDFLKSQGRKLSTETVYNYLSFLERAFIIEKASRFDLKGKKLLETQEKIFVCDTGIRNAVVGFRPDDIAGLLENIVYLNLRQKGYEVTIGKLDALEVDFIARKREEQIYIQVCYLLTDENRARELAPLQKIKDNYPKFLLTMSPMAEGSIDGIIIKDFIKFLLAFD